MELSLTTQQAVNRLAQRLQLPEQTVDVQISLSADKPASMTITQLLTPAQIEEVSTWYVVEGLDRIPSGSTTYDLAAREPVIEPSPAIACDPADQQRRQDRLEELYEADGRNDPAHPRHAVYTGLVAAATEDAQAHPTEPPGDG